jgi:hypothetical protein
MNKTINFQKHRKIRTSAKTKTFKRRTSVISMLITMIVIVSLCLFSIGSLSATAPEISTAEPQFNLDVTYAYVGQGIQNDTFTDARGTLLSPVSQYPSAVYFNITRHIVENVACDAILEVYNVKIASDTGLAENFVFFTGTNYNPSFSDADLNALTEGIYDLFDLNTVDGVTGNFRFNWTNDESILSAKVGSFGIYTNYINGLGLWSAGKPNTISVFTNRIGYLTMTNGFISIQPDTTSANNKTQVQLQKFDDGFLKNEIVPPSKLPQENRFQPIT